MLVFWLVLAYDLLEERRTDDVIIKTFFPYILILYYIKQIDSKLPCVCSVIDHREMEEQTNDLMDGLMCLLRQREVKRKRNKEKR